MAIDFSKFTFTDEQVRDVKDLLYDDIVHAPLLNLMHTIYPGIVTGKKIGFLGEGGLVGVTDTGCHPQKQDWKISARELTWDPKMWTIRTQECWTDLESAMAVYSLKTGVNRPDFSDTDYSTMVSEVLSEAIKKFMFRMFWFGDLDAKNITAGGQITDGVDVKYFQILDGFWKQIETIMTATPAQRVTITENAGATYADQKLNPDNVIKYLESLKFDAPLVMQGKQGNNIFCTQSFYNGYALYLKGKQLESTLTNLVNGTPTLTYDGTPLVAVPIWDEIISLYQNTGTKLINPHRAVYTSKDMLAVGVDDESSFDNIDVYFDRKELDVTTMVKGKADAKILNPVMLQVAI